MCPNRRAFGATAPAHSLRVVCVIFVYCFVNFMFSAKTSPLWDRFFTHFEQNSARKPGQGPISPENPQEHAEIGP